MPVRFQCHHCHARIRVPDGSEGRRVKCPRCGLIQHVPSPSSSPEPAVAATPAIAAPEAPKPKRQAAPPLALSHVTVRASTVSARTVSDADDVHDADSTPASIATALAEPPTHGADAGEPNVPLNINRCEQEPALTALPRSDGRHRPDVDDEPDAERPNEEENPPLRLTGWDGRDAAEGESALPSTSEAADADPENREENLDEDATEDEEDDEDLEDEDEEDGEDEEEEEDWDEDWDEDWEEDEDDEEADDEEDEQDDDEVDEVPKLSAPAPAAPAVVNRAPASPTPASPAAPAAFGRTRAPLSLGRGHTAASSSITAATAVAPATSRPEVSTYAAKPPVAAPITPSMPASSTPPTPPAAAPTRPTAPRVRHDAPPSQPARPRFDLIGLFLIAWALRLVAAVYAGGVLRMLVTAAPGSLLAAVVRVLMILAAAEALWILRDIGLRTRCVQPAEAANGTP